MNNRRWTDAVYECQQQGIAYALATVLGCSGSTPRDQSSKMVITETKTFDTLGGGSLEFEVTQEARALLNNLSPGVSNEQKILPLPLGGLGQCCGGNATVLIEAFAACGFQVALFGAGHVAKALINILGGLPCKVNWIDNRMDMFPENTPNNVTPNFQTDPVSQIESLPNGSDILILTHDHQLDYALTKAAIQHGSLRHIGLIGSETKAQRFSHRLINDGLDPSDVDRVTCPVGLSAVPGKLPMEVAVSIAGELIAIENAAQTKQTHRGLAWRDIKASLTPNTQQETVSTKR